MHPGGADNIIKDGALRGRGDLGNIIGNPLETTYFLSRLIFDGTFDKHPGPDASCGAHGGGYLPSYLARTDVACKVRNNANCANKKEPREYLQREIIADTMVFSDEGAAASGQRDGRRARSSTAPTSRSTGRSPSTSILNASSLSNADKEAILGGNLMKLLRITS